MTLSNKIGLALFLAMSVAEAQSPTITVVLPAQIRLPTINAPYLVAVSTDGQLHPVVLPAGVTLAAQADGSISISLPGVSLVRNEIPAAGAAQTWTLLRAPTAAGATCWRNGVHQSPGLDYTLAGNTITSASWAVGDVLACDYQ